ncbi:MAG TPA: biopolymer transporter ExbD [Pyrinomonadaceae bacterium]|nr:biopolymer transporter ExbD [Pyrinomonadaceae bacterium]
MSETKSAIPAPMINVTPLIDVLLVLLIIFMVAAPLKPHRFLTKVPSVPHNNPEIRPHIHTLVVTIEPDRTLNLNDLSNMGTVDDLSPLRSKLISIFEERTQQRAYRADMLALVDVPEQQRIEKTVFIKAPRSVTYGEVARVLDALKGTGADPIGLQLDDLR